METLYQTAKDIILKFKKKGYYEEFSQQDMFYFSFINEGKKMMMLFIDSFFGDSYGIQLFFNNNGFEYLCTNDKLCLEIGSPIFNILNYKIIEIN